MAERVNEDVAGRLEEVARLLAIQGANRFRVRAYERAAAMAPTDAERDFLRLGGRFRAGRAGDVEQVAEEGSYLVEERSSGTADGAR